MIQTKIKRIFPALVFYIPVALWTMYLYFFLHESGHALAVVVFKGKITEFVVGFNSHYRSWGDFTPFQNSLRAGSGLLFPFLVWVISIISAPRKTNTFLGSIRYIVSFLFLCSLLVGVVKPIMYENGWRGTSPWGDDITQFLDYSHWNGYAVGGSVLLLLILGVVLFQYKVGIPEAMVQLRSESTDLMLDKKVVMVMVIIILAAFFGAMLINNSS